MATNNFKPFGIGSGANVTSQTDYEALVALLTGFSAGKASSAQINKALRQGTVMASVLAQFIANTTGLDVLDNGNTATLLTNFLTALKTNSAGSFLQTVNNFSEINAAGAAAQLAARNNLGLASLLTGRLLTVKYITASGTYTPTAGTNSIFVQGVGTGGNGAGSIASGSTGCTCCSGGASGGYAEAWYASGFSSVAVTIGAIGALNYASGAAGGTSTFGSLMSIPGGGGGGASAQASTVAYFENGGGAVGGNPTLSGNISGLVTPGTFGQSGKVFGGAAASGQGASSRFGTGGGNVAIATGGNAGGNAAGYGAGGGGAGVATNSSAVYGGNATKGVFIVWEYA
ncbi:hypothetical protein EH227_08035 [Rouxiella chamberiensis]|nr:hypothetical protein EH227_08035 [Rouxiella chamberiensis]